MNNKNEVSSWQEKLEGKCWDCGAMIEHRDSPHMCRRCAEKSGEYYLFKTEIDHDKIRELVGDKLAEEILYKCKVD